MTGAGATPMETERLAAPRVIRVPVAGRDENAVLLPLDTLPADTGPVLDVLRAEAAPLAVWRDVARAYLAQVKRGGEMRRAAAGGGGRSFGRCSAARWRLSPAIGHASSLMRASELTLVDLGGESKAWACPASQFAPRPSDSLSLPS